MGRDGLAEAERGSRCRDGGSLRAPTPGNQGTHQSVHSTSHTIVARVGFAEVTHMLANTTGLVVARVMEMKLPALAHLSMAMFRLRLLLLSHDLRRPHPRERPGAETVQPERGPRWR